MDVPFRHPLYVSRKSDKSGMGNEIRSRQKNNGSISVVNQHFNEH